MKGNEEAGTGHPSQDLVDRLDEVTARRLRVQGGGKNHRLFCVLEREAVDLGGSSIVCIDGLSKPRRTAANPRDYRRVKRYGDEFQERRTVLR